MKKLNSREIQAIASVVIEKIRNEKEKPIQDHNKKVLESKEYKNIVENSTVAKELNSAIKHYKKNGGPYNEGPRLQAAIHSYASYVLRDKFKKEPASVRSTDVEREITIANIDSQDVNELIDSVMKKFR